MTSIAVGAQESRSSDTRSPTEAYRSRSIQSQQLLETTTSVDKIELAQEDRVDSTTRDRRQTSPRKNGTTSQRQLQDSVLLQRSTSSQQISADELQSNSNTATDPITTIPMTNPPGASSADNYHRERAEPTTIVKKERHKSRVLDPSGSLYHHWTMVVSLAFLYNFWSLSYRFAFQEIDFDTVVVWFALDYSADLIYILDVVMNFHTGYLEDGVLQRNVDKISVHYRECTQFYLDCFCLLPLDILYLSIGFNSILRCTRLVKIYKFWSYVERAERHTNYPNIFRTFTLVHYILVIFHWNACIFHMISKNKLIDIENLYKINDNRCDDILCQYLKAFYWSTLALTTVGDLPRPRTKGEYIYVTVELFFGLFLFASVLGYVANIVTNVSAARKEFQAKLDAVKTFMRMRRVSDELQSKVIRWFDYLWISQQSSDEDKSVLSCLPDRLKAEIAIHVHLDTLKRVDIFQNTEAGFLCELVLRLKPVLFSPGDYVCRKNEVGHEMYIVSRGILEVVTNEGRTVVATLKAGSYFGEISMLNVGPAGNRRTASVRSVGYSDLFCLNKQDLWDVLKNYPNAEARIRARAEERLSKLSDPNKPRKLDDNGASSGPIGTATTALTSTGLHATASNPLGLNGKALLASKHQHSLDTNRLMGFFGANNTDNADKLSDSYTASLLGSTNLRAQLSSGLTQAGAHRRRVCSSSSCSKPIAAKLIATQRISQLHSNSNLEIDPPNLATIATRDSRRTRSHRVSSTRRCMGCHAKLDYEPITHTANSKRTPRETAAAKIDCVDTVEIDDRKSEYAEPGEDSGASECSAGSDYEEGDNLLPGPSQRCLPMKSRSDCFGLKSRRSCSCAGSVNDNKLSIERERPTFRRIRAGKPVLTSLARRNQVYIDHQEHPADELESIQRASPVIQSKSFETARNQPMHSPSYYDTRQVANRALASHGPLPESNDRRQHQRQQSRETFSTRSVESTLDGYPKRNRYAHADQLTPRATLDEFPISRTIDEVNGPNLPQQLRQPTENVAEAMSSPAISSQTHLSSPLQKPGLFLASQSQQISHIDLIAQSDFERVPQPQRRSTQEPVALHPTNSNLVPVSTPTSQASGARYTHLVPGDRSPMSPFHVPSHVQIPVQVSVAQANGHFLQVPIAISSSGSNVIPVQTVEGMSSSQSVIQSRSMSHLTPIQLITATAIPSSSHSNLLPSDAGPQTLLEAQQQQQQQQYLIVTTSRQQSDLNLSSTRTTKALDAPEHLIQSSVQTTPPKLNQSDQQTAVSLPIEFGAINPQTKAHLGTQNVDTNVDTSKDLRDATSRVVDQSAVETLPQTDLTESQVSELREEQVPETSQE